MVLPMDRAAYARMSTAPPTPGGLGDRGGSGKASNNKALSDFIRSWDFLSMSKAWEDSAPSIAPPAVIASMDLSIRAGEAGRQVRRYPVKSP